MTYYIPQHSQQTIGGGWTFIKNISKGLLPYGWVRTADPVTADIILIAGATMTERAEIEAAKAKGTPIIFRVDNVPKDSRNRGTAIPRMRDFAKLADLVIYQSEWAKMYAGPITGDGMVIYNGVDKSIFKPSSIEARLNRTNNILYVQYARNENKRWEEAAYAFMMLHRTTPGLTLHLVGQFSPEVANNNFDFWNGENIVYHGVQDNPEQLAAIMQECSVLLFPAFADAAPNTVLEALACGMDIRCVNEIGGTQELLSRFFRGMLPSIEDMGQEYANAFNLALNTPV